MLPQLALLLPLMPLLLLLLCLLRWLVGPWPQRLLEEAQVWPLCCAG
jgi:hypothetical protein